MYLARVFSTISAGSSGGWLFLSQPLLRQPIANELLVVRRLPSARLVLVGRPESRAIGRHHFVDQDQLIIHHAELELRIGDDDPAPARVIGAARVQLDAPLRKLLSKARARPGHTFRRN